MRLTFRPIHADEVRTASLLVDAAYASQRRQIYGNTRLGRWTHYDEAKIISYMRREPEGVRVGFLDDRMVTFNVCRSYGSLGWYHTLAVHPEFQGRGLGRQAVTDAEAYLTSRDVTSVALMTWPIALKHLAFYLRLGYQEQGLSVYAYRDSLTPIISGRAPFFASTQEDAPEQDRNRIWLAVEQLGHRIMPGLDYSSWLQWAQEEDFAETLLLWREGQLAALILAYFFSNAGWAEGKLMLIQPGLSLSDQLWVLEHLRLWVRRHGCETFGLPTMLKGDFVPRVLLPAGFRLYPESMINMVKGDDLPDPSLHFVRFGG